MRQGHWRYLVPIGALADAPQVDLDDLAPPCSRP
jgi:hypothetical protein